MIVGSANVETTLLLLKIAFLVLLYLFIWRIVRSAARDLRLPQESMILSPQQASSLLPQPSARENPSAAASKVLQRPFGASMCPFERAIEVSGAQMIFTPPARASVLSPNRRLWHAA